MRSAALPGQRRQRRRGNFISRRDARRPSQRNYLLRLAVRRRLAWLAPVGPARPAGRSRTRHARSTARRDGQPCLTVGRFRPIRRRIVKSRLHLPCCQLTTPTDRPTDVCAADRYSSVFERRRSSGFSIVLCGRQQSQLVLPLLPIGQRYKVTDDSDCFVAFVVSTVTLTFTHCCVITTV